MQVNLDGKMFLGNAQVRARYGHIGYSTLWRLIRDEGFPEPIKILGTRRWRLDDIIEWEKATKSNDEERRKEKAENALNPALQRTRTAEAMARRGKADDELKLGQLNFRLSLKTLNLVDELCNVLDMNKARLMETALECLEREVRGPRDGNQEAKEKIDWNA